MRHRGACASSRAPLRAPACSPNCVHRGVPRGTLGGCQCSAARDTACARVAGRHSERRHGVGAAGASREGAPHTCSAVTRARAAEGRGGGMSVHPPAASRPAHDNGEHHARQPRRTRPPRLPSAQLLTNAMMPWLVPAPSTAAHAPRCPRGLQVCTGAAPPLRGPRRRRAARRHALARFCRDRKLAAGTRDAAAPVRGTAEQRYLGSAQTVPPSP